MKTLIQEHPQLGLDGGTIADECEGCIDHRYKRMDYCGACPVQRQGDLISGNVKRVDYQKDQPDRFHHSYTGACPGLRPGDADNRITEVETSADGQNWHRDARYFYYPHGPLERVELGEHLVQGMDYAYTLQGWLKGINGDRLNPNTDMGRDGDPTVTSNPNLLAGRDAYALSLGYYGDADYKGIASSWDDNTPASIVQRPIAPIGASGTANTVAETQKPLYNGNIAHTVNTLQHFGLWDAGNGAQGQVLAQVYHYDQLNRLKKARGFIGMTSDNTWSGVVDAAENRYRSQYEYDANGNIETAERWNASGAARYDSLHYHYHDATNGRRLRNRLYHLQDLAANGVVVSPDPEDLAKTMLAFDDVNPINTSGSTNNYRYDALGNLVSDNREGITNIDWTVAGKVRSVMKASGPTLAFDYGASGQRTLKQVSDPDLDDSGYREHYIRDAQGNIMATYRFTNTSANGVSLKLTERPVYGSSRLGSLRKGVELYDEAFDPQAADPMLQVDLNYELTDHLGNVCAVVTGRLLDGNGGGTPKQADLLSAQGYEPFGSLLPGRNYSSDSYRFGFQGQEKDDEVFGSTGTSYTAEFWQYDPRIGRRWNEDPVIRANWSGYVSLADNPIMVTDKNGDDWYVVTTSGMYIEKIEDKSHPDGIAVRQADGSFSYHVFNDQEHDVNNMESNLYFQQLFYGRTDAEPVVHILTEKDMLEIARDMSGGRKMWVGRHVKAFIHSQGGDMDGIQHLFRRYQTNTMHDLHRNEMGGEHNDSQFYLNTDGGRAYNYHDYGNYLWGAAMYDIGFDGEGDLNYILKAANDHSEASGAGPDTNGDQQAISSGYAARKFSKAEF